MSAPEISVVIPVYNEAENLPVLVKELHGGLSPAGRPYEILLVDDGSNDGSDRVMDEIARADARVRVIRLSKNSGQSAAFEAGFRFARGRIVVTCDADLQNDPADIPKLLELLEDCDVACGIRATRRDTFVRRISSKIGNGVRNRLTRESVTDTGCSLKAFRADYLKHLPMFTGMHRFLPTLARMQGARVRETPVNHRPRLHGTAKYGVWNRLFRTISDLFAVRWMQTRWIDRTRAAEATPARAGDGG